MTNIYLFKKKNIIMIIIILTKKKQGRDKKILFKNETATKLH